MPVHCLHVIVANASFTMPSKKNKSRAAQLHPQPAQSDYDTDTANPTDAAPQMAPPPQRTNNELNMLVLKRYLPDLEAIETLAPFAVVYFFSSETQQWEKSGVEGTLFVCRLSAHETGYTRYNVVILNRKGLDNFVTELVSGEDIQLEEQYLILQVQGEDGMQNIYGLWIFEDESDTRKREEVVSKVQECAVRAEMGRASWQQNGHVEVVQDNLDGEEESGKEEEYTPAQPPQSAGQQIDLLSLFNKPAGPSGQQPPPEQRRMMPQSMPQQQPAQPQRFTSTADTDFFRSSRSPANVSQQQTQPPPQQQNALLDLFKSAKKG